MSALEEEDLKLFVDAVRQYFDTTTRMAPEITSAFLDTDTVEQHEFNGIVSFSGKYRGQVLVSMPATPLRELLLLQNESDLSEASLLDAVGEIANTLAGNARRRHGAALGISVPQRRRGPDASARPTRRHPYCITLKWNSYPALVVVDIQRAH